ncbi:MAG: hypothetical protein J5746_09405 [Victivallales bacterium]|nr:hypothetical protein [Victivallales bacterium]
MISSKPSICGLVSHLCRSSLRLASSIRLRIALLLLVLNFPLGYGGIALFAAISGKTGNPRWLLGGAICYALSWAMLFAGTVLAGTKAGDFSRVTKGGWRAWKRLRTVAACLALALCFCGCNGVQMPQRPLAYMYPSLMPMSALKSFHGRNITSEEVKSLFEKAGLNQTLVAYGFLDSDYAILARGLAARGYAEIDARHCKKCPFKWLYISFGETEARIVLRPQPGSGISQCGFVAGSGGELVLCLPLPEETENERYVPQEGR